MKPMMATHYARLEGGGWTPIPADSIDTALANGYEVSTAPSQPGVDELANFIRTIDGNHQLGAGALAEKICAWLSTAQSQPSDETMAEISQLKRECARLSAGWQQAIYAAQPRAEALVQAALEAAANVAKLAAKCVGPALGEYVRVVAEDIRALSPQQIIESCKEKS